MLHVTRVKGVLLLFASDFSFARGVFKGEAKHQVGKKSYTLCRLEGNVKKAFSRNEETRSRRLRKKEKFVQYPIYTGPGKKSL